MRRNPTVVAGWSIIGTPLDTSACDPVRCRVNITHRTGFTEIGVWAVTNGVSTLVGEAATYR